MEQSEVKSNDPTIMIVNYVLFITYVIFKNETIVTKELKFKYDGVEKLRIAAMVYLKNKKIEQHQNKEKIFSLVGELHKKGITVIGMLYLLRRLFSANELEHRFRKSRPERSPTIPKVAYFHDIEYLDLIEFIEKRIGYTEEQSETAVGYAHDIFELIIGGK